MASQSHGSYFRGANRPLTDEEILEHALRELVKGVSPDDVRGIALELRTGNVSVLDMRAGELLRQILLEGAK